MWNMEMDESVDVGEGIWFEEILVVVVCCGVSLK